MVSDDYETSYESIGTTQPSPAEIYLAHRRDEALFKSLDYYVAQLTVHTEGDDEQEAHTFKLKPGIHCVGRDDAVTDKDDVLLDTIGVSKIHAIFELADTLEGPHFIEDLESTNSTFINNIPIRPRVMYQCLDGNKISFGPCAFIFKTLEVKESAQSNGRITNVYHTAQERSPLSSFDEEEPIRGNDEMIQDSMATLDDVFVTKKKRSFLIESEDEDEEEGNEEIDDNMFDIGNPKSSQQLRQETPEEEAENKMRSAAHTASPQLVEEAFTGAIHINANFDEKAEDTQPPLFDSSYEDETLIIQQEEDKTIPSIDMSNILGEVDEEKNENLELEKREDNLSPAIDASGDLMDFIPTTPDKEIPSINVVKEKEEEKTVIEDKPTIFSPGYTPRSPSALRKNKTKTASKKTLGTTRSRPSISNFLVKPSTIKTAASDAFVAEINDVAISKKFEEKKSELSVENEALKPVPKKSIVPEDDDQEEEEPINPAKNVEGKQDLPSHSGSISIPKKRETRKYIIVDDEEEEEEIKNEIPDEKPASPKAEDRSQIGKTAEETREPSIVSGDEEINDVRDGFVEKSSEGDKQDNAVEEEFAYTAADAKDADKKSSKDDLDDFIGKDHTTREDNIEKNVRDMVDPVFEKEELQNVSDMVDPVIGKEEVLIPARKGTRGRKKSAKGSEMPQPEEIPLEAVEEIAPVEQVEKPKKRTLKKTKNTKAEELLESDKEQGEITNSIPVDDTNLEVKQPLPKKTTVKKPQKTSSSKKSKQDEETPVEMSESQTEALTEINTMIDKIVGVELDTPAAAASDDEVKIEKAKPGKRKSKAVIEKVSEIMPTASKKRKSREVLAENEEEEAPVITESKAKKKPAKRQSKTAAKKSEAFAAKLDDIEEENSIDIKMNGKRASSSRSQTPTATKKPKLDKSSSKLSTVSSSSAVTTVKIMFTGIPDGKEKKNLESIAKSLGGTIVDSWKQATHLIAPSMKRTVKFLCSVSAGKFVVSDKWLVESKKESGFIDENGYLLIDKACEGRKLLANQKVYTTPSVMPYPDDFKEIVETAGGKYIKKLPVKPLKEGASDNIIVIGNADDVAECKKIKNNLSRVVYSKELILDGILKQNLNFDETVLKF